MDKHATLRALRVKRLAFGVWRIGCWVKGAANVQGFLDQIPSGRASFPQLSQDVLANIVARTKGERFQLFRKDPYVNALHVKYAYAVTCHKAQGGQWKSVFVDQGYVMEEMIDREYVRWLYTAVTRASEKLYLLNFHPRFFGEGEE